MRTALGVDLGGTTTKFGLVSEDGALLHRWETPTVIQDGGRHILGAIAGSIRETLASMGAEMNGLAGIGLAVPGPVEEGGVVNGCLNLGWGRTLAGEELCTRTGFPVVTGNDGNMAAWGEMWKGAARGTDTFVMLTLGTGIGGGVVVRGRPLSGHDGSAGEVGHILVDAGETRACVCGRRGCMEQYGSARALERSASEYLHSHPGEETILTPETRTARDVMDAAKAGDRLANLLVSSLCDALGKGTGILAAILNPDLFVIGGGLAASGAFLLGRIQDAYRGYAFPAAKETPFALAALGSSAAVYGCARAVLYPGG